MRITKLLGTSLLSLGLFGAACSKHDTDKAAKEMQKAREDVDDKAHDLSKSTGEARKDVAKDQNKLDDAKIDLQKARADFSTAVSARLARIDAKLQEASAKADAKAKDLAAQAKAERDALQTKLDTATTQGADHWDGFKKDVEDSFDSIEKKLDDATK